MTAWRGSAAAVWDDHRAAARVWRGLLAPAALAYGAAADARNALYEAGWLPHERVNARVVSVGNLTVGGTGKTPITLWLATALAARGRRVAIVARGYRKRRRGIVVVGRDGTALVGAEEGGDEAVLMASRFAGPVVAGEDRVAAARHAVAALGADTIVLDDGFQHRRLARDVDLVLLAADPRAQRFFPAGPLREGVRSLARASAVLLVGAAGEMVDSPPHPRVLHARIVPQGLVRLDGTGWRSGADGLAGREVVAVAGIARPERFEATLVALGAVVRAKRWLGDHHWYDAQDVAAIRALAGGGPIVTTEKDLVKLAPLAPDLPLSAVRLAVHVDEAEELLRLAAGDDVVVKGSG